MNLPLVSVVCLCYNQDRFVEEALQSVLQQTYPQIQLIVIDDASTDNSPFLIKKFADKKPGTEILLLDQNLGNCKAFNRGLTLAKGEFIIDLAADDVMLPERITQQVNFFSTLDRSYGVVFTDATYINEKGAFIRDHYQHLIKKRLIKNVPQGEIFPQVLSRYFIASPTMMIKREVLEVLNGYDENLSYEDFDFWVRSARIYKYGFLNAKLTKIRRVTRSMSAGWYVPGDKQLHSTYLVCKKALALCHSGQDYNALAMRLKYELRQSVFSGNHAEADLFYELLTQIKHRGTLDLFLKGLNQWKIPLSFLRKWYHQWRYD